MQTVNSEIQTAEDRARTTRGDGNSHAAERDIVETRWRDHRKIARDIITREMAPLGHFVAGHVLDVGSGGATYQRLFAPDATLTTLDISPRGHPDVVGTALELPFREKSFDSVISTQALEHLSDPFRAIAEMHRVLKPSGRVLLTAPQTWPEHLSPHDYFRFTQFGLKEALERAGFIVEEMRPCGAFFATLGEMLAQGAYFAGMRARRSLTRRFLRRGMIPLINRLSLWLERKVQLSDGNVLNWIVVARRE